MSVLVNGKLIKTVPFLLLLRTHSLSPSCFYFWFSFFFSLPLFFFRAPFIHRPRSSSSQSTGSGIEDQRRPWGPTSKENAVQCAAYLSTPRAGRQGVCDAAIRCLQCVGIGGKVPFVVVGALGHGSWVNRQSQGQGGRKREQSHARAVVVIAIQSTLRRFSRCSCRDRHGPVMRLEGERKCGWKR